MSNNLGIFGGDMLQIPVAYSIVLHYNKTKRTKLRLTTKGKRMEWIKIEGEGKDMKEVRNVDEIKEFDER